MRAESPAYVAAKLAAMEAENDDLRRQIEKLNAQLAELRHSAIMDARDRLMRGS